MSFDNPVSGDTHLEIMFSLREASARSTASGDQELANQYDVASRAMSLMAKYDMPAQPYVPMVITTIGDSGALADFSETDVEVLERVLALTHNDVMRARIADILLLVGPKEKRLDFAGMAIEAYERHPIDSDSWWKEGDDSWRRALQLTGRFGKLFTETRKRMAATLEASVIAATATDVGKALSMADVLWHEARGLVSGANIAAAMKQLSEEAESAGDTGAARGLAIAAGQWYSAAGDDEARFDLIDRTADLWMAEAETRGGIVAATFYQDALQTLRQIPRAARAGRGTEAKIAEAVRFMQQANDDALNEMHVFVSEPFDGSQGAHAAEALVRGKDAHDALRSLALGLPATIFDEARERATKSMSEHPFRSLFQTTHIARDGRVVHKTPGTTADDQEASLHRLMLEEHSYRIALVAQSLIVPALLQVRSEHDISMGDFAVYCRESGFVPLDRINLFAKGLYYGFELDMEVAIHLLAPQLENAIRQHLKAAGVNTTFIDGQGIEMEIGLTNLMDKPEAEALFGPDLAFEIRATFTDQLGPNFRNDVAHGLVSDSVAGSGSALYAWWLCLRIVLTGFWNRVLSAQEQADETAASTEDPLDTSKASRDEPVE